MEIFYPVFTISHRVANFEIQKQQALYLEGCSKLYDIGTITCTRLLSLDLTTHGSKKLFNQFNCFNSSSYLLPHMDTNINKCFKVSLFGVVTHMYTFAYR